MAALIKATRFRLTAVAAGATGLLAGVWWDGAGPDALIGAAALPTAVAFAALHAAARLHPVNTPGRQGEYGYNTILEVLAMLLLPLRLAAGMHLASMAIQMLARRMQGRGLSFAPIGNCGMNILATAVAQQVHLGLLGLLPVPGLASLVSLPAVMTLLAAQMGIAALWMAAAMAVPITQVEILHRDSLLADTIMMLVGALTARLYILDPAALILTALPTMLLYRILHNVQQARLARIDPKTGLYNYRHLDEALAEQVRRAAQTGAPLSVIFIDMDYLRDVNNTYGHLAGDRALIAIAAAMSRMARPQDVAARFGGEEFVLLLPGLHKHEAAAVAERLGRDIAALRILSDDGNSFRVTISAGVAGMPADATTVEALIQAADAAVYQAKHLGRNRVCIFGSARADMAVSVRR